MSKLFAILSFALYQRFLQYAPASLKMLRKNSFLDASDHRQLVVHLNWSAVTRQEDRAGGPLSALINYLDQYQGKKFIFTRGHQRHKIGKRQVVKAVHSHNLQHDLYQYVVTNRSSIDKIRGRQESPVIWWRERRLAFLEERGSIKRSTLSGRRGRGYVISLEASLCAFHFQVSKGCRQGAKLPKKKGPALDRRSCPVLSWDQG